MKRNDAASRFEVEAGEETGILQYSKDDSAITLVHTEVPPALEGRGIGGELAKAGLEYARQEGLQVVPRCGFVVSYIKRHPEYLDLVRPDYRARVSRSE